VASSFAYIVPEFSLILLKREIPYPNMYILYMIFESFPNLTHHILEINQKHYKGLEK